MERFVSTLRPGLPDIDIDVESARRLEAYDLIYQRFGPQRVACVSMAETYRVRHAVRDVGAALGSAMGGGYVNYFSIAGRSYKVIPQVQQTDRLNPDPHRARRHRRATGKLQRKQKNHRRFFHGATPLVACYRNILSKHRRCLSCARDGRHFRLRIMHATQPHCIGAQCPSRIHTARYGPVNQPCSIAQDRRRSPSPASRRSGGAAENRLRWQSLPAGSSCWR